MLAAGAMMSIILFTIVVLIFAGICVYIVKKGRQKQKTLKEEQRLFKLLSNLKLPPFTKDCIKLAVPLQNLAIVVDDMTTLERDGAVRRAMLLSYIIMAFAGRFVAALCDQKDQPEVLRIDLNDTNLDVITAEAAVWTHFLMEQFWWKDREAKLVGDYSIIKAAPEIILGLIKERTGCNFKTRWIESRKLYVAAAKNGDSFNELFASIVFQSLGCQSLAEPLKTILAPPLELSWIGLNMTVKLFYISMPSGFYGTFKNILKQWPDRFK